MAANPEIGEFIKVQMSLPDSNDCVTVSGIVHWSEMRGKNHEVGVFTQQPLPHVIQDHYLNMRRQAERYRCRVQGQICWTRNQIESAAVVVNYSFNGLSVRSDSASVVDEPFTFNWVHRGLSRQISAAALWQIEQDGGFLIAGCPS